MRNLFKNSSRRAGMAPGTLTYMGKERREDVKITVYEFDESQGVKREIEDTEECRQYKTSPTVSWIKVVGIHDVEVVQKIGGMFDIHPLVLEDIINTSHPPKYETHENYLFTVSKVLWFNEKAGRISDKHMAIITGDTWVISFQEYERGIFRPLISRIMDFSGRIRKRGADYLTYAILDTIVDNYFVLFEQIDGRIEGLDDRLMGNPNRDILDEIYTLKRDMVHVKRNMTPIREGISQLMKDESPLIKESTDLFIRDLYDHAVQAIDAVDNYRETLGGMIDIYISTTSFKMNEVMKVLTIIATIFIPLTFIAGIYGMNFEYMPELHFKYAYFIVMGLMFGLGIGLMIYFRKRGWF